MRVVSHTSPHRVYHLPTLGQHKRVPYPTGARLTAECRFCSDPQAAQNLDGDGTGVAGDMSSLVQSLQDVDAPALSLSAVRITQRQTEGGGVETGF